MGRTLGAVSKIRFAGARKRRAIYNRLDGFFREGNQYALAKTMDPEKHTKRMQALFRGWQTRARQTSGEKFVSPNQIRKREKRKRIRLHQTVAKEAREIQDIARTHATAVVKRLAEIAEASPNEAAAIAAGQVLLDRAYGKASQTNINATVDANGKPTDVSAKELDTRIEKALERVNALTGGTAKTPARKKQPVDLREHDRDPDSSSLH